DDGGALQTWGRFGFEKPLALLWSGALLARQRVFILSFAADLAPLGDDFGSVSHHHINSGIVFLNPRIGFSVASHHRDAFDAAADRYINAFIDDLVRG